MTHRNRLFLVDDDPDVRDSLQTLLEAHGFEVMAFASAEALLQSTAPLEPGCLLVDVRMPGMSGLELQEELNRRRSKLCVVVLTGHADVPLAVRAMKAGAVDFLEKPFDEGCLLESVRRAIEFSEATDEQDATADVARKRMANLTERERQVMQLLVTGRPNKIIAYELSISPRTVEIHRARVMDKMAVRSLAELVRLTMAVPLAVPN